MSPRDIFAGALLSGAARIVVVHNHPSGECEPSQEDLNVMQILKKAGELLDIPLLDFVIIGSKGRHWSSENSG